MAKGKKTGGNDFKPGNQLGIAGRKPTDPDVKAIQKASKEWASKAFQGVMSMHPGKIRALIKEVNSDIKRKEPTLEIDAMTFAALRVADMATKGHLKAFELILDRLVGKPAQSAKLEVEQKGFVFHITDKEAKY